jgi:hypothetical protein
MSEMPDYSTILRYMINITAFHCWKVECFTIFKRIWTVQMQIVQYLLTVEVKIDSSLTQSILVDQYTMFALLL